MTVPENASIRLQAESLSGPIRIPSSIASEIRGIHQFSGKLNTGENTVFLKTLSGPVSVVLSSVPMSPRSPDSSGIPDSSNRTSIHTQQKSTDFSPEADRMDSESIISGMLADGKITQVEADQLRAKL
jgi:hypothetical protein